VQVLSSLEYPATEIGVGDIVLLEVLQGARDDRHATSLASRLAHFRQLQLLGPEIARRAAANYRTLRQLGITLRSSADLIIGTFCIEHSHALLHADRDFAPMVQHLGLQVI
jgi:hypothetical protein